MAFDAFRRGAGEEAMPAGRRLARHLPRSCPARRLEWIRFRRVTLLVVAKGLTALLLAITWAGEGLPALMVVAVPLEGSLALAGALLHGPAERSRRARARLRLVTPVPERIRPAGRS